MGGHNSRALARLLVELVYTSCHCKPPLITLLEEDACLAFHNYGWDCTPSISYVRSEKALELLVSNKARKLWSISQIQCTTCFRMAQS